MYFKQLFEPKLAQNSYLIGCQETVEAIVIDPMRDIERYIAEAEQASLKIVAVTDTHIHADYLSGMREMAERLNVKILASDCGDKDWKYDWVINGNYNSQLLYDGDVFFIGNIKFEVLHTPGHTPEHISFLVTDTKTAENPVGIISGDFVFVGDVGRPDLLESAVGVTNSMKPAAKVLYDSLKEFQRLPGYLQLWPGHGAGSACGKALGAIPMSTVGYEVQFNPALQALREEKFFINYILDGQPEPPAYFSRMKTENRSGPAILGELPQPEHLDYKTLFQLAGNKNVELIDTREWEAFRKGHVPGALFTPLNKAFNTVAGCYLSSKLPIYLVIEKQNLNEAILDLIRIGLDNIAGYFTPEDLQKFAGGGGELAQTEEIHVGQLKERLSENSVFLLDVRRSSELKETGFIGGAYNIAHTRLRSKMDELPADKAIMVQCRSGERSKYATAFLERNGYRATNIAGGILDWVLFGGELEHYT